MSEVEVGPSLMGPSKGNEGFGVELSRSREPLDSSPFEGGDFNDILSNEEKWGRSLREERSFRDFKDLIDQNGLIDIGYEGHLWTWSNHWEEKGEIRQRLDRCLASYDWVQIFEKARCQHLDTYASDHSLLCLDTVPDKEKRKKKFYFDKRWLQKEGCQQVVKKAWQIEEPGSHMFKITKKIRNC
ncbi:uncharacterized protein [Coffea arabica]|uniref:Uncharacterized protein n=1 Tax=Coffea arabica TaxID=13443 RepID=A0ABM4U1D9_COFAR